MRITDRGRLPIILIIVAFLVVCLGIGAFTFTKMGKKGKAHSKVEKPPEVYPWKLQEFVVNLADVSEPHYLKVNITLEMEGKPPKGEEGGSNPEEAKVRDTIIMVLSRKTYFSLISEKGKMQLKNELKTALNSVLHEGKVANIYFTDFAMQ
jgi:flagellar FliL protein